MGFSQKLNQAVERNNSLLCIGLDPNLGIIPEHYRTGTNLGSVLAWNQALIEQTHDLVCAYKPNIAFYEALGAPGMEALRTTLSLIPSDIPVILDAKRGDIGSTAVAYAHACFDELGADAVTLNPYLGRESISPFTAYQDKGLFVLCHTSNPGADEFQKLEIQDWHSLDREPNRPLYIHVARTVTRWAPNIGLVVGATYPQALRDVREVASDAWILVPGIGSQGGDLEATLQAGLRQDGKGLVINVSRGVSLAENHRTAALALRDRINQLRATTQATHAASVPLPTAAAADADARRSRLLRSLADAQVIQFGDLRLVSGIDTPFYIDLSMLAGEPTLLAQVADAYADLLEPLSCDRIAGIPYAGLIVSTALSLLTKTPLLFQRKEGKAFGLGKSIEGAWAAGERVVLVEDFVAAGANIVRSAQQLRQHGLVVEEAIALVDYEQGGGAQVAKAGLRLHTLFTLSEVIDVLSASGHLDAYRRAQISEYITKMTV